MLTTFWAKELDIDIERGKRGGFLANEAVEQETEAQSSGKKASQHNSCFE